MLVPAFLLFMGNIITSGMVMIAIENKNNVVLNVVFAVRMIMAILTIIGVTD